MIELLSTKLSIVLFPEEKSLISDVDRLISVKRHSMYSCLIPSDQKQTVSAKWQITDFHNTGALKLSTGLTFTSFQSIIFKIKLYLTALTPWTQRSHCSDLNKIHFESLCWFQLSPELSAALSHPTNHSSSLFMIFSPLLFECCMQVQFLSSVVIQSHITMVHHANRWMYSFWLFQSPPPESRISCYWF